MCVCVYARTTNLIIIIIRNSMTFSLALNLTTLMCSTGFNYIGILYMRRHRGFTLGCFHLFTLNAPFSPFRPLHSKQPPTLRTLDFSFAANITSNFYSPPLPPVSAIRREILISPYSLLSVYQHTNILFSFSVLPCSPAVYSFVNIYLYLVHSSTRLQRRPNAQLRVYHCLLFKLLISSSPVLPSA